MEPDLAGRGRHRRSSTPAGARCWTAPCSAPSAPTGWTAPAPRARRWPRRVARWANAPEQAALWECPPVARRRGHRRRPGEPALLLRPAGEHGLLRPVRPGRLPGLLRAQRAAGLGAPGRRGRVPGALPPLPGPPHLGDGHPPAGLGGGRRHPHLRGLPRLLGRRRCGSTPSSRGSAWRSSSGPGRRTSSSRRTCSPRSPSPSTSPRPERRDRGAGAGGEGVPGGVFLQAYTPAASAGAPIRRAVRWAGGGPLTSARAPARPRGWWRRWSTPSAPARRCCWVPSPATATTTAPARPPAPASGRCWRGPACAPRWRCWSKTRRRRVQAPSGGASPPACTARRPARRPARQRARPPLGGQSGAGGAHGHPAPGGALEPGHPWRAVWPAGADAEPAVPVEEGRLRLRVGGRDAAILRLE